MLNMHAQIVPNMLGKRKASMCGTPLLWRSVEFSRLKGRAGRLRAAEPDQCAVVHVSLPWVFPGLLQSPLSSTFTVHIVTTVLESKDVRLNLFCKQKLSRRQMTELQFSGAQDFAKCPGGKLSLRLELNSSFSCQQSLLTLVNLVPHSAFGNRKTSENVHSNTSSYLIMVVILTHF